MAKSQRLPFEQSLFVTTPNKIYLRTQLACETLFECETPNGIVNARASKDNSSLFAIADGQVVILHDASRTKDRKYKLKSGDGEPRLLLFSPDSRTLYFTTTLNNSVQAYSIPDDKLLPSLPSHPSPPNVIAISSNGTILLSASPNPMTIYLQDQRWGHSAPVDFRPTDARYSATCAAFQKLDGPAQPSYTNFVIGFQDGLLAMYRLFLPSLRKRPEESRKNQFQFFQLQPVRVGAIKKLHKPAMGGILAAEFVPGYKSRVVSIRVDGMVLLGGDAAEDAGDVYEGFETLIAIGTQAGKVLVFNALGLLIHEITVGVSITAVEWVGNMTAPSILPTRGLSLSPKPRFVVDIVDAEGSTPSDEETGTVKKTRSPHKSALTRKPVPVGPPPDLFSDESRKFKSRVPSRRASDVLRGSPLRVERVRNKHVKKPSARPRISTETFQSPPEPSPHDPFDVGAAKSRPKLDPPIQESRRWPEVHQMPSVPAPSRAQLFSAPHRSLSSSDDSQFSDQEWFTPPFTRRRKPKVSQRHMSSESPLITSTSTAIRPVPFLQSSPTAFNTPSSLHSRPTSGMMKEESVEHQETVVEAPSGSRIVPKLQRHVTIADPGSSSPLGSSSGLYSRPTAQMFERPSLSKARELELDLSSTLPDRSDLPILKPTLRRIDSETESPSNVCSCSTPSTRRNSVADESANDMAGPNDIVSRSKGPRNHAFGAATTTTATDSSSSLESLYYPAPGLLAKSSVFQNYTHRNLTPVLPRQPMTNSLDTRANSPSSVYPRSISGAVKDTDLVNAGLAEGTDRSVTSSNAPTPSLPQHHQLSIHALDTPLSNTSLSTLYSPAPPGIFHDRSHAVNRPSVKKSDQTGLASVSKEAKSVAEEMKCLYEDQRALRQEVAALREEYRVLEDMLLKPKAKLVV
ncbi:hypothetical protein AA0119_g4727 [Alternaria tenuissima]|uniref:WD40 repeat-like protein n=1 Tax=Alternaria tenuissima TaxID=119927 RepID=A0AB37WKG7_9PLEO|nr:hypothetical protein AA0115_g4488 [Alternaria tenuissima]RYO03502.1 hypothetical protein AA0119_g4727 [Alternaria tenuissima]